MSFRRYRGLNQSAVLIFMGLFGLFGAYAQATEGNVSLAIMFGIISPLAIILGAWVMRHTRDDAEDDW